MEIARLLREGSSDEGGVAEEADDLRRSFSTDVLKAFPLILEI